MKLLSMVSMIILAATLLLTNSALAGQREGAFSLSPMAGYYVFDGSQNTDDGFVGGLSLGYNVTKHWAAELEGRYTPTDGNPPGAASGDIDLYSVGMNALYHFNPEGPFVPYVSAGFGGMFFVGNDFHDDSDYMMNWGVGAKYFIVDDIALRLDLRHIIDFHSDREWDRSSGDNHDSNFMATAGLYWQFGGAAPAPLPPLDSDSDGIPDLRDKCPDTPLGVMVDAVGCPPQPKPAPQPVAQPVPPPVVEQPPPAPMTKEIITFNLLFGFDKYDITDEMIPSLEQAKIILDEDPAASFLVLGHTCSIGTESYNQQLSEQRANSIKSWLVNHGIAAERLESIGYGESQPKYDNSTREGRKLNRRVEIQTR